MKATHLLMFLLGVAVWHALPSEPASSDHPSATKSRPLSRRNNEAQATAWIDATLADIRKNIAEEQAENRQPATMEEFLRKSRAKSEEYWKEEQAEIDEIIAKARTLSPLKNPANSLFSAQGNQNYMEELVIFQHWLNTNPDTALAELQRNWALQEKETVSALLVQNFGTKWALDLLNDDNQPLRLRRSLSGILASQAARGNGLTSLVELYNQVSHPALKSLICLNFANEWPRETPDTVAHAISAGIPKELHDTLIAQWSLIYPYQDISWDEAWIKELHERLEMGPFVAKEYGGCGMGFPMDDPWIKRQTARESMTFEGIVQDCIDEGKSEQESANEAIRIQLGQAMNNDSALFESFKEGQITRDRFLEQLQSKIPGAASHSDLLEQQAFEMAAWKADPVEIARWAADLSRRGNIDDLLVSIFENSNYLEDPRIPMRLARVRSITEYVGNDAKRINLLLSAMRSWSEWHALSPTHANAWKARLPESDPLLQLMDIQQTTEKNRKEHH